MKPLAIVLFAVLALSFIPLLAGQQAQALSAVTFTSLETVTSQGTGTFQRVYENGTSSLVFSDANRTAAYFKSSYNIGTDTLDTDVTTLTNTTYTATAFGYNSPVDLSRYSMVFDGSTDYATASANTIYDITTEDFWMFGTFCRTSDSGGAETIVRKKSGVTSVTAGYLVRIEGNDRLAVYFNAAASTQITATIAGTTSTATCYAWAVDADRSGLLTIYQYDMSTDTLSSATASMAGLTGSATNTQTFTVARDSASAAQFFPGRMDMIIPPQISSSLSQAQFLQLAEGDWDALSYNNLYDFNEGISGLAIEDVIGSNNLTPQSSPAYSSDVTSTSTSRLSTYIIGRDDNSDVVGVAKLNTGDLSEVDDEYFSSDLAPLDLAQSTASLYSPAFGPDNSTGTYGILYDVSVSRQFGSYTETSIHTGNSSVPAYGVHYDNTADTATTQLRTGQFTGVAQLIEASSDLIGDRLDTFAITLDRDGSPTGNAEVGTLDSSGNMVFRCGQIDVSTVALTATSYLFVCGGNSPTLALGDRIGIRYTGGSVGNEILVHRGAGPANSKAQQYAGSWADSGLDLTGKMGEINAKIVVYDGSPDVRYHIFESGTSGDLRIIKRTGSTSLLSAVLDSSIGQPFSVAQLTDRIIIQTGSATYQLLTSSDAVSQIHGNTFLTRYPQTFSIAPAARTFNSAVMLVANATYATNYVPNTGSNARTGVMIDTITTGGSGTLTGYDPSKFYYLPTNDMVVDASTLTGTSWTIRDIGTKEQVSVTGYSEYVGIDLAENTTEILDLDVVKINCDNGNYLLEMQYVAVGSDNDCVQWWTYDTPSGATPRKLPYTASGEVVHANEYNGYTVQLSVADPSVYQLTTIYDAENVDTGAFDSGGNTLQQLLFNQCYTMQIEEESTGNVLQTGNICAGNIDPITISLSGIVIPDDWLKSTWSYNIQRNYTTNQVLFTFQKSVAPYNGSLFVTDNALEEPVFEAWYNFTDVTGASIANVTGTTSNMTLYFTLYENGVPVLNAVSNAEFAVDNPFSTANFGLLFGVPAAFIFPVLTAAMFPRSLAYFGAIVTVAVIGILSIFGYISLPAWFWPLIMPIVAFAVFVGYKRS